MMSSVRSLVPSCRSVCISDCPYIRTLQAILNVEDQMMTTNKSHQIYDEMVNSADVLKPSSQSETTQKFGTSSEQRRHFAKEVER